MHRYIPTAGNECVCVCTEVQPKPNTKFVCKTNRLLCLFCAVLLPGRDLKSTILQKSSMVSDAAPPLPPITKLKKWSALGGINKVPSLKSFMGGLFPSAL